MSDLEENVLQPYGEDPKISFNQNTVPFDFDGKRLMWLTYVTNNVRELNIFSFETQETTMVNRFQKADGMVSHVKFLKSENQAGNNYIVYVKDTTMVIRFNLQTKDAELIGTTNESILATYVTHNRPRGKDVEAMVSLGKTNSADVEKGFDPETLYVVCLDEAENVTIFHKSGKGVTKYDKTVYSV